MSEASRTSTGQARASAIAWRPPASLALPIALIAVCIVFTAIKPVFLTPDNLISIVHQIAIIGIMAIGMTFVVMTGGIDLSVGPVLAIAASLRPTLSPGLAATSCWQSAERWLRRRRSARSTEPSLPISGCRRSS